MTIPAQLENFSCRAQVMNIASLRVQFRHVPFYAARYTYVYV